MKTKYIIFILFFPFFVVGCLFHFASEIFQAGMAYAEYIFDPEYFIKKYGENK